MGRPDPYVGAAGRRAGRGLGRRREVIDQHLLDILACPGCKGAVRYEEDRNALVCDRCRLRFRIEDDIPVMLLDEAENLDASSGSGSG